MYIQKYPCKSGQFKVVLFKGQLYRWKRGEAIFKIETISELKNSLSASEEERDKVLNGKAEISAEFLQVGINVGSLCPQDTYLFIIFIIFLIGTWEKKETISEQAVWKEIYLGTSNIKN